MNNFYNELYEGLYRQGYHSNQNLCHTTKLFSFVDDVIKTLNKPVKILDVGCSHGLAVEKMITQGIDAYGIDPSNTAIEYCKSRKLNTCIVGSATEMPYSDNFFDIIVSSDTLEHILMNDLDKMAHEFKRICSGYFILSIACDEEGNKSELNALKMISNKFDGITTLHTALLTPDQWDELFKKHGMSKVKTISYINHDYMVIYKNDNLH